MKFPPIVLRENTGARIRRVLALGTSITNKWGDSGAAGATRSTSADSYLFWMQVALMGQVDTIINKAVSGNNTTQMLARYATDVAANYASFDTLIFEPGPNDYGQVAYATIISNISTIVSSAISAGKQVILLVPTPSGSYTSATFATWQEVRKWMYDTYNAYSYTNTQVILIDVSTPMADPLTGYPLSVAYAPTSVEAIHVHPSMTGAQMMGRKIADSLPVTKKIELQRAAGQRDYYELLPNPKLQGNNASASRNFYAGAGVTVTGGADHCTIGISAGTFSSVTIAPVTPDGTSVANTSAGSRLTIVAAGSDRSVVSMRIGSSDSNPIFPTQYGRWDSNFVTSTGYKFGDHARLTASPLGVLTCISEGTSAASTPTAPTNYGETVTSGTTTWLWQRLPAVGDVVIAEVEYEIESVTGGVGLETSVSLSRAVGSETFVLGYAGAFDVSAALVNGLPNLWMPRKGVIKSLPLTLQSAGGGVNLRHVFVQLRLMFPSGGGCTIRIDRVSLRLQS